MAKISYDIKQRIITLAGTCFWYWGSYYTFLDACGISKSLQQKFPRNAFNKYDVMRNILGELEDKDDTEAINAIISNFYRMRTSADDDVPDPKKAKKLLEEFKVAVGDDPIENELKRRQREQSRKNYSAEVEGNKFKRDQLKKLNESFITLHSDHNITPQERGYKLEEIMCDLFELNEMEYKRPYKHQGEQIDGHFRYEKFDYLIECKWEKGLVKQSQLSIFDGKIRGKAQSTRGVFIATNGFDPNAVIKFSGDSPRIILMKGEDLALVLSGQINFLDALKAKVEAIVLHGNINFSLRELS